MKANLLQIANDFDQEAAEIETRSADKIPGNTELYG
jgi:hypothetical protein